MYVRKNKPKTNKEEEFKRKFGKTYKQIEFELQNKNNNDVY